MFANLKGGFGGWLVGMIYQFLCFNSSVCMLAVNLFLTHMKNVSVFNDQC